MTETKEPAAARSRVLATVARLVTAADGDTVYRDVYLRRAGELLAPVVTEATYQASLTGRDQLATLLAQARAAVARQDWPNVREIGGRADALQRSLASDEPLLAAAETVYAAPAVVLDPLSPGLASKRWSNAALARTETTTALAELARDDAGARDLYAARQRALEALALPGAATPAAGGAEVSAANVEQLALQALERGDAGALAGLADSMLGRRTPSATADESGAARGAIAVPGVLGEPLPGESSTRATTIGLEPVEITVASGSVSTAVADFIERYALGASPAVHARSVDGVARVALAAEDIKVPPDVAALFAETISLFALHVFVNSAGVRYVPLPAPREVVLVEPHPDGDEAVSPLLRELGLDRRRGISRDDVEARLRGHGGRILADHLGLDPIVFRLVCIPADVFMRVGRERGWGQRPEWTHFDGYQVMKGSRLRALVGGNAKFGGLFDLCSISRDDERDNTVVRFAVIRRERLGVRIG